MSKKLKCAIIGYGYMGEIRHRVIDSLQDTILTMVCESDHNKIPIDPNYKIVSDPEKVINSDVDVVFICTPNHLIPDLTIKCINNGKHTFCEKPPGKTVSDIERMIEAERMNPPIKLMFGFNHRFHPAILKAKEIVDSGSMGNVIMLRGLYGKSGGNNFKESWRNDIDISGGGILLDQGIHMLDIFNYFIGNFTDVKALLSNYHWDFGVEDNAIVILKNKSNQLAMLHSSATFWKHMFNLKIILDNGYLIIDGLLSKTGSYGREKLVIGSKQFEDQSHAIGNPSEKTIFFDDDNSWEIEVGKFIASILDDKPVLECNSTDAYDAMNLVYRSYADSNFDEYHGVIDN